MNRRMAYIIKRNKSIAEMHSAADQTMIFALLFLTVVSFFTCTRAQQHRSFSETKFDLNPDLAADEILASEDGNTGTLDAAAAEAVEAISHPASMPSPAETFSSTASSSFYPPVTIPFPTFPPIFPHHAFVLPTASLSSADAASLGFKPTPLPFLPSLMTSPPIQSLFGPTTQPLPPIVYPNGSVSVLTPPSPPSFFAHQQYALIQNPQQHQQQAAGLVPSVQSIAFMDVAHLRPIQLPPFAPRQQHFFIPAFQNATANKSDQNVAPLNHLPVSDSSASPSESQTAPMQVRPKLLSAEQTSWFRDDFDKRRCARNAELIGESFLKKLPRNLLKSGKERVLSDLLTLRLKTCLRKERENHWQRLNKIINRSSPNKSSNEEHEDCLVGLIQEQIACINLHSFSCQFVQPDYGFRLLPIRMIVHEAQIAEAGAAKCRKFIEKYKISMISAALF